MQIPLLGVDCDYIIVPMNGKNKIIYFVDNSAFQNYIKNIDGSLLSRTYEGDEYCL